jgi:hypothetical protein
LAQTEEVAQLAPLKNESWPALPETPVPVVLTAAPPKPIVKEAEPPAVSETLVALAQLPPAPGPAKLVAPAAAPLPPAPIHSIELLELFQSDSTVHGDVDAVVKKRVCGPRLPARMMVG